MKVPVFEELRSQNLDEKKAISITQRLKQEKRSFYIDLTSMKDKNRVLSILEHFHHAFTCLNFNPSFPYPLYFITKFFDGFKNLNIVEKIDDLPQHFFQSFQRLNAKEIKKLKKIDIISGKIQNIDYEEKLKMLKDLTSQQKRLYEITHEALFYEEILDSLEKYKERDITSINKKKEQNEQ